VLEVVWVVEIVAATPPRLVNTAKQKIRAKGERFNMENLALRWTETR
jgi:hypothetical protein